MTANHDPQLQWGPETRTWVSLLLFVHLFMLFVAVTTYTRPSTLQTRLHELFAPYLRNLHLTAYPVTYPFARYHLTHATESDADFFVEVDVQKPDGSSELVTIPADGLQPLVRFRRYQALADVAGTLASGELGEGASTILPKLIAASVLARHQASGGSVRIRAHRLPDIDVLFDLEAVARAARENVNTTYEAQVITSAAGVELLRKSTTLEEAPVESRPRGGVAPPRRSPPKNSGGSRP
jgi:hypothetical protein